MTPEEKKARAFRDESTKAVHRWAGAFTVSMIDRNSENQDISSGVLILVENRLFVATAAHCIPTNPEGRLWLLPDRPRQAEGGMLGFINYKRAPDIDIGFLELSKETGVSYFESKNCLSLNNIRPMGIGGLDSYASIVGFPADRVNTNASHRGYPALKARVDAYTSIPLPEAEWKDTGTCDFSAIPEVNIVMDYPATVRYEALNSNAPAYRPNGYSGGGIWDHGHPAGDGLVWSSEKHASLIGLQSYWYESTRQLFGIQIIHWLKLINSHYPDLREVLKSQFPDLKD